MVSDDGITQQSVRIAQQEYTYIPFSRSSGSLHALLIKFSIFVNIYGRVLQYVNQ